MKTLLISLLAVALAAPAMAQQRGATGSLIERSRGSTDTAETIGYAPDPWARMTVPVTVGGRGPFQFIVDTGAERTVISQELAQHLGLSPAGDLTLASVSRVSQVPSVIIPELDLGRRTLSGIHAPALSERNIGAQGMLGVDSLRSQRVVFDFDRRELTLTSSSIQEERSSPDEIIVRARTRLGRMIITNAAIDGQRVTVIIDTGSQVTLGNAALRRRLESSNRLGQLRILSLTGVTGDLVTAEATRTRRLQIGGMRINDLPVAFSEVRLFSLLGLSSRPAILLGMDALQLFGRVSIDFANRRVRLSPSHSRNDLVPLQVAGLARGAR
jgi:predicted aspartyl protease